jgi:hypothetical protein
MMHNTFPNFGFMQDAVPENILNELHKVVVDCQTDEYRIRSKKLAGNIESTFQLPNLQTLESYLIELCQQYSAVNDISQTTKNVGSDFLALDNCWVNIQKKNEFNPIHSHDGDFSFVIWLTVPYNITEEHACGNTIHSNSPRNGMFSFFYSNIFGEIREAAFPVDSTYEGRIFLFPGCLSHMVYPFQTSEKHRISISGNLTRKLCTIL